MVICCSLDKSKYKCIYYKGKDCNEKLCENLGDQATKTINYEKKKWK